MNLSKYVLSITQIYGRTSKSPYQHYAAPDDLLVKAQPAITCSKLTTETLEEGVRYVQS